jgi:hypothetical protein
VTFSTGEDGGLTFYDGKITLASMTLLQTRVDDRMASQFKQAARKRKMSPYRFLSELVKQASSGEVEGWTEHCARLTARNRIPLPINSVISTREGEDR